MYIVWTCENVIALRTRVGVVTVKQFDIKQWSRLKTCLNGTLDNDGEKSLMRSVTFRKGHDCGSLSGVSKSKSGYNTSTPVRAQHLQEHKLLFFESLQMALIPLKCGGKPKCAPDSSGWGGWSFWFPAKSNLSITFRTHCNSKPNYRRNVTGTEVQIEMHSAPQTSILETRTQKH